MGIFTKLKDFVGLNEAQEYEYEYDEATSDEYQGLYQEENGAIAAPEPEEQQTRRTRERPTTLRATSDSMSNVIGMPGAANGLSQVMVMEPRSFEEMPQAIQALRERKSVVLNLTMMDPDQAQRAVDFVAGGTYALDGHQERIGDSIFLFAPSCVQVTSQSSVLNEA
ncbi:MAG: cell division protein SepF, partial [Pseudanabaena sp.]